MADNERDLMSETPQQRRSETSDDEHDRIRASNDLDQELEREGIQSKHNRGYDEAVKGVRSPEAGTSAGEGGQDVDPDSAEAEVDRDDTVEE